MIYTMKYPNTSMKVDTDRIARKFLKGGQLFIYTAVQEERIQMVEYLEEEGFCCVNNNVWSREKIIDSVFPLRIVLKERSISSMGNTTTAAAAVSSGVVMSSNDFYLLYSVYKYQQKDE